MTSSFGGNELDGAADTATLPDEYAIAEIAIASIKFLCSLDIIFRFRIDFTT
jgi:hypothetical protein